MCNVLPKTLKKVKEYVDFIYDSTLGEGMKGSFTKQTTRIMYIAAILVKRGVLKKEGHVRAPIYVWAASMAPTRALYESVAKEMVLRERDIQARYRKKSNPAPPSVPAAKPCNELDRFPSQALWDELKSRGYEIEGDHLVLKKYLN